MHIRNIIFTAILCFVFALTAAASSPKREMRGVWVATVWGIDWPSTTGADKAAARRQQAEMTALLDRLKGLNFTTVCFQVRSMGDVMYDSALEPWSGFLTGKRGNAPAWDPLAFVVDECHRRGLECYAWVNPFRWSTGTLYDTPADRKWRENGWLLTHGKYTVFNPGMEEVRQHIVEVCREIVDGYDVDGLVFDDYFYPNRIPETKDAPDYSLYLSDAPWMDFGDWRRACVHKAVADVSAMIRDTRRGCRFGISPAGVAGKGSTSAPKWGVDACDVKASDWQYAEIYSDPLGLMYQGTVDFISPQIYWGTTHATAPYGPIARWWAGASNQFGSHFYPSVTLERLAKGDRRENIADLGRQIDCNRAESLDGNQGIIIYSAKFVGDVAGCLRDRFAHPSLTPVVAGGPEAPSDAPRGLRHDGSALTWRESDGEPGELMRYTVYAVPPGVGRDEAMAPDGDGIDGRYLLGVTYEPRYDIGRRERGWRYAVCAYSPSSAESAPAWLE